MVKLTVAEVALGNSPGRGWGTPGCALRIILLRRQWNSHGENQQPQWVSILPSGVYNAEHLINVGSNRWSLRSEIGFSHPMGRWFVEGSAGVWIFTNNLDFYGGHVRGLDPLWTFQAHAGDQFAPNLWISADANYNTGRPRQH
jgi:hypothetical protein